MVSPPWAQEIEEKGAFNALRDRLEFHGGLSAKAHGQHWFVNSNHSEAYGTNGGSCGSLK